LPPSDPLLLFHTPVFGKPVDVAAMSSAAPGRWTIDKRRASEAAAVIFHMPDFREFGDARRYPGQLWVAWSMESKTNYPLMADPRFMQHFDIRMTYESDADVWTPYLPQATWWRTVLDQPLQPKSASAPVAMFQSSRVNLSGRERFAAELSRHIEIDSYGRFLNNQSVEDLGGQTKIATIARYHFCIAFENSISPDYVTEKLFDPLYAGTVPVYLGAPNVNEFAPENSYINVGDFAGPRELAAYLRHLVETPSDYAAYFDWRLKPLSHDLERRLRQLETPAFSRLQAVVHRRLQERPAHPTGQSTLPFGRLAFLRTRLWRWRRRLRR
jgi:alpha-1,3-fucosyltransferase 10